MYIFCLIYSQNCIHIRLTIHRHLINGSSITAGSVLPASITYNNHYTVSHIYVSTKYKLINSQISYSKFFIDPYSLQNKIFEKIRKTWTFLNVSTDFKKNNDFCNRSSCPCAVQFRYCKSHLEINCTDRFFLQAYPPMTARHNLSRMKPALN